LPARIARMTRRAVLGIHQTVVDHVDIGRIDQFFQPSAGAIQTMLLGRGLDFGRVTAGYGRLHSHSTAVHGQAAVAQLRERG
jgi:hypothetical protein